MYALADPTESSLSAEPSRGYSVNDGARSSRRNDRQDFRQKRKDDRPDNRYGSYHVAAVEQDEQAAGGSQRPKYNNPKKQPWDKKAGQREWSNPKKQKPSSDWSFEAMLDQPCSFHTAAGGRPAGHTTQNCSWMTRARRGDGFGPPRTPPQAAPPLTGANTQALPPPPPPRIDNRAPQGPP